MDAITEKTRELGEAILASDAYKRMNQAEERMNQDAEARLVMAGFEAARADVQKIMQDPNVDKEQLMAASSKFRAAQERMQENEVISDFLEAREAFSGVIDQVNRLLRFVITGQIEEDGCNGNCSGCSGCR